MTKRTMRILVVLYAIGIAVTFILHSFGII